MAGRKPDSINEEPSVVGSLFAPPLRKNANDSSHHKLVPITKGVRVRVLEGRSFQNFAEGDSGVVLRVDDECGTCDVAFDGREGSLPVAIRHLEAEPRWLSDQDSTRTTDPNDNSEPWVCEAHHFKSAGADSEVDPLASVSAVQEFGVMRTEINELRELILRENKQRVAGIQEVREGVHMALAKQMSAFAESDNDIRTECKLLEQKQTELASFCSSLESFRAEYAKVRCTGMPEQHQFSGRLDKFSGRLDSLDKKIVSMDEQFNLLGQKITALSTTLHAEGTLPWTDDLTNMRAETAKVAHDLNTFVMRLDTLVGRIDGIQTDVATKQNEVLSMVKKSEIELLPQWGQHLQISLSALQEKFKSDIDRIEEQASEVVKVGEQTSLAFEAHQNFAREKDKIMETLQVRVESLAEGLAVEARLREEAFSRVAEALKLEQIQPNLQCLHHDNEKHGQLSSPQNPKLTTEDLTRQQSSPDTARTEEHHDQHRRRRSAPPPANRNSKLVSVQPGQSPNWHGRVVPGSVMAPEQHSSQPEFNITMSGRNHEGIPDGFQQLSISTLPVRFGAGMSNSGSMGMPNSGSMFELNQTGRSEYFLPNSDLNRDGTLLPHDMHTPGLTLAPPLIPTPMMSPTVTRLQPVPMTTPTMSPTPCPPSNMMWPPMPKLGFGPQLPPASQLPPAFLPGA